MSSEVLSLFSKFRDRQKAVEANTGTGSLGWWPPEGDHVVFIESVNVETAKFRYRPNKNDKATREIDAISAQFVYRLTDDPDAPNGEPRSFKGRAHIIPLSTEGLPDNQQTRVRIADERFKGHLKTALGHEIDDTEASMAELLDKIESFKGTSAALTVKCRCNYQDSKAGKRVPDEEFLVELIST
jgi:hypothetical protein